MGNRSMIIPVMCAFLAVVMLTLGCASSSQAPSADLWVNGSAELDGSSESSIALSVTDTDGIKTTQATEPTLSITVPEEIKAGKGIIDQAYYFELKQPTNIPAGAVYTWFANGQAMKRDRNLSITSWAFSTAKPYTLNVVASWVDNNGKKQTVSSTEVTFTIPAATFSVRCEDNDLQDSRKGVFDKDYRFYTSWGEGGGEPLGANYIWSLNYRQTDDKGEDAHFTFSAEDPSGAPKHFIVEVVALWMDSSGNQKNATSVIWFDIGPEPTLSIKVPDEITAGTGVKGGIYTFDVEPKNIQEGASYTWFGDGQQQSDARVEGPWKVRFENEKDYSIKVQAKWSDIGGKTWIVTSPEEKFHIGPAAALTLYVPSELSEGKGIVSQEYFLEVKPMEPTTDIPADARYTWYSNGEAMAGEIGLASSMFTFTVAQPYTLKVIADWTGKDGKKWTASSQKEKFLIEAKVTLIMPDDKGPDAEYIFMAVPQNIPPYALYGWWINDVLEGQGGIGLLEMPIKKGRFKPDIPYNIKVKVIWSDGTYREAQDSGTFTVSESPTIILHMPSGEAGPGVQYAFTAETSASVPKTAVITWLVNEREVGQVNDPLRFTTDKGYFSPGEYKIDVIAEWRDDNDEDQLVSDTGIFTVKAAQSQVKVDLGRFYCCCNYDDPNHYPYADYTSGDLKGGNGQTTFIFRCKSCGKRFEVISDPLDCHCLE